MDSEESSDVTDDHHKSEQISAFLVQVLKDNQVLLDKAHVANSKTIKKQVIEIIRDKYENKFREKISTQQITKKISNMKWRTKYKLNLNKNGSRQYVLKDWEKGLIELLEIEENKNTNNTNNINNTPTNNNKIQRSLQQQQQQQKQQLHQSLQSPPPQGFQTPINQSPENNSVALQSPTILGVSGGNCSNTAGSGGSSGDETFYYYSFPFDQSSSLQIMEPPPNKKNKMTNSRFGDNILSKYETDETSQLNDVQLQRLVLLKQNLVLSKKLKMMQMITTSTIQTPTPTMTPMATQMQTLTNHNQNHHQNAIVLIGHNVHQQQQQQHQQQQQQQHQQQHQQQQQQQQHQQQQQQLQQQINHQINQQLQSHQQHQQQQQQQQQQIPAIGPPPPISEVINGDVAMEIKSRNLSFDEF